MKKYIVGLSLVLAVVFAVSPLGIKAETVTVESLQAQVNQLLQLVSKLQAELATKVANTPSTNASPVAWCHTFTKNLKIGDTGADVDALQTILAKENVLSASKVNFAEEVASAVTGFQEKYKGEILTPNGLSNGTGFVGVSTRAKLNKLYGCGTTVPNVQVGKYICGSTSTEPAQPIYCDSTTPSPELPVKTPPGKYICGSTSTEPAQPIYCDSTKPSPTLPIELPTITPVRQCQKDSDCKEISCVGGGFAHEQCISGRCVLSAEVKNKCSGTTTPPVCAQVMKQCSNGSQVGYKPGTCEYQECPYICGYTNSIPGVPIYCSVSTTPVTTN